jgi:hypothetical protein
MAIVFATTNNVLKITGKYDDPIFITASHGTFTKQNGIYSIYDDILKQNHKIGAYTEVPQFGSDATMENYLMNFFCKAPSGGWMNDKSILFGGTDEYILIGNVSELNFDNTDTFSIACWFKTSEDGSILIFAGKREQYGNGRGWEARFRTDNDKFIFILCNTDGSNEINVQHTQTANQFNDGNWHLLIWTYDGSSAASGFTLDIDNNSKSLTISDDTLNATTQTTENAYIGTKSGILFPFVGNLNQMSIWDKALSSGEKSEIWNSGSPKDLSLHSAVANLTFWQYLGTGDTYPTTTDYASAGNDGTMINMESGDIVLDVP